jgi:hypothetical protein
MATVNKDFKIKHGLIVEGTTGTIDGNDILTKNTDSDNYIIDLIGGETLITSVESTQLEVISGELNVKANVFDSYGSASAAEGSANSYTDGEITTALQTAQGYADTAESDANGYTDGEIITALSTAQGYANTAEQNAIDHADALTTDDVAEGATNKYFSDSLARDAVDNGDGLNYDGNTGVFSAHLGTGLEFSGGGAIQIDDSVVVTEMDLTTALNDHDVASGVHGVTGNVVGTTDSQTLSNKTLGGDLAAGGFQITNLGTPNNSTDAATKGYVDAVSEGLHVHPAARAAILTNVAIATALENGDTAGGVTLATGDRILLNGQTNGAENGIYVVQASGQALRATDFDTATEVDSGDFIFVSAGTYANTGWVQTLKPATVGSDPISFTQFSGAGTFTAGNGLTLDGTVFEIDDTITATKSYVDTELDAHIDLTDNVHGVSGNVVGTSDSQTLTNKTLGSGTVLSASIDAVNTYTITNLEEPVGNQDAATKFYVDGAVNGVAGDLSTHESATTGIHGVTGNIVGTSDSQTLTNKTINGSSNTISNIANASLVNDSITINGSATALGGSVTLDTDDVAEGTAQYFTDVRAKESAADLLTNASKTNITITGDENGLTITAENGVADSTTADLDEDPLATGTSGTMYFTNARAVSALEAVVPDFTAVEINSIAKQVAATTGLVATASTVTAYSFAKATYRSAKFLVKTAYGSHTEVSEVLLTLDASDNVAITEYAIVGTNGSAMTVSADVSGTDVRLRVQTANNNSTVNVVGTLLA